MSSAAEPEGNGACGERDAASPLVSVITPTYNRAGLIGETLESVFAQDYRPVEVIVVDDGSTDDTENVVRSFEPRARAGLSLRYVRQENSGAPAARNRGFRESKGDYIQFLDSDDSLGRAKLRLQIAALAGREGPWVAYGPWRCLYDNGKRRRYGPMQQTAAAPSEEWMLKGYLSGAWFCPFHSYLFPRAVIVDTGPCDVEFRRRQDAEYLARILIEGWPFMHTPGAQVTYLQHTSTHVWSRADFRAHFPSLVHEVERNYDLLAGKGLVDRYLAELKTRLESLFDDAFVEGHKEGLALCAREASRAFGNVASAKPSLRRRTLIRLRRHVLRPLRRLVGDEAVNLLIARIRDMPG
ncbi:MAG: glycosyltransferase family 2 protein [Planctomycetota bacterium]|jgi:glycosyltransferase involved in cell wall biosynthesis